jgi:hypothetical protein
MSKQSEKVKIWRKRCKERIITAMGGKCCVCGYNRCQSALALHHLDPAQKDIGLGAIRANPKSWITIVKELRKCILVCHVCHSEIHEGIIQIPIGAPKFDESFVDYKKLESDEDILTPCPVCNKPKPAHLKNCSYECSARSKYRVDWDNIDLQEELKTKSIVKLSEELGCSDATIHKRMKKIGLK